MSLDTFPVPVNADQLVDLLKRANAERARFTTHAHHRCAEHLVPMGQHTDDIGLTWDEYSCQVCNQAYAVLTNPDWRP